MRASWLVGVVASMATTGCIGETDRAARAAEVRDRAQEDARVASGCAQALLAAVDRSPVLVANALEIQHLPAVVVPQDRPTRTVVGTWARAQATTDAAERTRRDIARREATLAGDLARIAAGTPSDPAALDRAFRAGAEARQVRDRLCPARDVATTLVAMARHRSPAEETASAGGGRDAAAPSGGHPATARTAALMSPYSK